MAAAFSKILKLKEIIAAIIIGFAVLAASSYLTPAVAQEAPADIGAYCVQNYSVDTIGTFDRRDNAPLCSEKTNQGLGLLHHKVDPAEICQSQHNTARYRQEGTKIFCVTGNQTQLQDRKVNLTDYCRKNYGQSAIVSKRLTDNAPLCTVKGNGGLSQMHHAIDLAQLCGRGGAVSPDAVEGDVLDCAKTDTKADASTTRQIKEKLSSGPKRPTRKAVVPETAIVSAADRPDLTGCGAFQFKELVDMGYGKDLPPKHDPKAIAQQLMQEYSNDAKMNWDALSQQEKNRYYYERATRSYPWGWAGGSVPSPCPGLTGGGFVPDLEEYCRTRYANPDPNYLFWLPNGRPVCHPTDWSTKAVSPSTLNAISTFEIGLYTACIEMYPDQAALRIRVYEQGEPNDQEVGTLYPILKFADRKVECYYLEIDLEAKLKLVERTDGVIREVTGDLEFYGGPFFYQVRFNKPRDETTLSVAVSVGGGDEEEFVLSRVDGDELLYRSEPFLIKAPINPEDPLASEAPVDPGIKIQP